MARPNILWICTDQQRFDTLGCYGNGFVRTPNVDRLAKQGVLFEQAYAQSSVCTPSRVSFMTGRYPRTTGILENGEAIPAEEKLVSRLLADAGYACGLAGKLHLSPADPSVAPVIERRIDDGFAQFHWSHHPMPTWPTNEYSQWLRGKGKKYHVTKLKGTKYIETSMDAEDGHTAWCAEKAIEFMEANARLDPPWMFMVNTFDPHHPFNPPKSYLDRYLARLEEIPLPAYEPGELSNKPRYQLIQHKTAGPGGLYAYPDMSDKDHRLLRAAYWAMVDVIDEQVGRMLDALERTGQRKNTLVIFMSDHGELLGDHGMYLKGAYFYDVSIRMPLIMSMPGTLPGGRRISTFVELLDLAPTLLDAAGLPRYAGMQGRSMWKLLTSQRSDMTHRRDVYSERYHGGVGELLKGSQVTMLRTQGYKLVVFHGEETGELYDLWRDPGEVRNRWADAHYKVVKQEMLRRLSNRITGTLDPLPRRIAPW